MVLLVQAGLKTGSGLAGSSHQRHGSLAVFIHMNGPKPPSGVIYKQQSTDHIIFQINPIGK